MRPHLKAVGMSEKIEHMNSCIEHVCVCVQRMGGNWRSVGGGGES